MVVIVWQLGCSTSAISAYHHLKLRVPNPANCEVFSIQHCVIKIVSDLRQVDGFSANKTYRHDITEILSKVALNAM
jgi:hypothetical protein